MKRTSSHEPLATNHYAPPARIATCVFGVPPDLYMVDRDQGVFVPQTLRFGGLWLGVTVCRRCGQDAGVVMAYPGAGYAHIGAYGNRNGINYIALIRSM